jgi:membrane protease YdiL (CAAX protease family)
VTDPLVSLVGVALALFGLEAFGRVDDRFDALPSLPDDGTGSLESDLRKWAFAGLVVGYVLVVEGESLSSIGVEPMAPVPFAGWVVVGTLGTWAAAVAADGVYGYLGLTTPEGFIEDQLERPVRARVVTAVTAGVTETVLFQAYPIERLAPLLGGRPAAGAVAFLAFTGAHHAGDTFSLEETVFIGVPALSVTVLYVVTGNVLVIAAVHALVDGLSLLLPELEDGDPVEASPQSGG